MVAGTTSAMGVVVVASNRRAGQGRKRPQMASGAQPPIPNRPGQHHLPQPRSPGDGGGAGRRPCGPWRWHDGGDRRRTQPAPGRQAPPQAQPGGARPNRSPSSPGRRRHGLDERAQLRPLVPSGAHPPAGHSKPPPSQAHCTAISSFLLGRRPRVSRDGPSASWRPAGAPPDPGPGRWSR
jgi:hypothetical protein